MHLHTLLQSLVPPALLQNVPNLEITSISEDSRRVSPGALFVARKGTRTDGSSFVKSAVASGAVAVLSDHPISDCTVPLICMPDVSRATSILANTIAGNPSHDLRVIGITGTNGKTTTSYLIRHILAKVSRRCGMIGTVEIDDGSSRIESNLTTPAAVDIAAALASMKANQCAACAMEVSSHALAQHRVAGVKFAGAGFTNLTRDHLDYHKDMNQYAAAKASLFESLDESAVAIVNDHDPASSLMIRSTRARVVRFGTNASCDYRAMDWLITATGVHFILKTPDGSTEVKMPLVGRHNLENALCAAALCGETMGLSAQQIAAGLSDATGAPGRLQVVPTGLPFTILVDYAHTDDALKNVLSALRPLAAGKLRVVFGCGGDRDRGKRPKMGRIAQQLADAIYITSDNPRTENPQTILDEIVSGLLADSDTTVCVEMDRRRAIAQAIEEARDGDVVLLAGKGHENYQIIGTSRHHFDDVEEAMTAAKGLVGS